MEKPPRSANRSGKSTPTRQKDDEMDDEEERLRLEQEEKERAEEALRKLEEERRVALNAIREKQEQETESELENLKNIVIDLKQKHNVDPEWERYLRCDGRPDPTSLTQINTFIALTKDKKNADINLVLEDVDLILSLIKELNSITNDPEQTTTPEQVSVHKKTILSLQDLLLFRYNEATLKMLKEATYEADAETGNLQKVVAGVNEVIMLWGNLNKNPRFKSYEFEKEKFQFELPKSLAVADVAVRVLKTFFDHYSHRCSTFLPKSHKPVEAPTEDIDETEEKPVEEPEKENDDNKKDDEDENEEDAKSVATSEGRKSKMSTTSNRENEEENRDEKEIPVEDPVEANIEKEEAKDVEIELEEILDPDVVDLRQFHPLGGIYHIDLLEMPPQPKAVKGWTLTQVIDKPLTTTKYPLDHPVKTSSRSPSAVPDSRDGGATPVKTPVEQQQPPIGITFNLPADVMVLEEPQVATWDKSDLHWKTKGITDASFDEEKRVVSFKTNEFGIFSLSQDGHLNMPFQSWELKPKNINSCILTITGAIVEVEIEIKETHCRLNPPAEDPPAELAHLHNKWMSATELILALKRAGVNLFPAVDSHKFVSIQSKDVDVEKIYHQMAVLSSGFAFAWSKWNNDAPKQKIVFQVAPFLPTEKPYTTQAISDDDWSSFVALDDICYMLAISEFDEVFNDQLASGCDYHCDILHAVRNSCKRGDVDKNLIKDATKRSKSVDAFYVDTVFTLLKATKLITFS